MVARSRFQENFHRPIFEYYGKDESNRRQSTAASTYSTKSNKQCTLVRQKRVKRRKPAEDIEQTNYYLNQYSKKN
ncbi:hypothetical protein G6F46_000993 [Rhizopus delemar]|uniref:Uncharacterized protein n=2 Tax=Rhizopus TaxID=4842 RepID=A0A9P6Z514_9FUNG|nr:hypothetical protein G6F43_009596 [Rhizopus delemar]KAG1545462.1 hypothetical protein G6F51_005449 [Rhizopus arrhizus]KAG1466535.1 hypothetical protein G6F55_000423 [Rhizopus delemar]KAG1493734.1 hypothetical protein G6F52_013218 [Rhizopus delemar]KAG1504772.1 hypothetical protein G6F54_000773 [Rhizopus delemar]